MILSILAFAVIAYVIVTDDRGIRRMLGGSGSRFMSTADFLSRIRSGKKSINQILKGLPVKFNHYSQFTRLS